MIQPKPLTREQREICENTMGSYAFWHVVMDALLQKTPLSVIRVSDGEKIALAYCEEQSRKGNPDAPFLALNEGFRKQFGVEGITCSSLWDRIHRAVDNCSHFAPTLEFWNPLYDTTPLFMHNIGQRYGGYVDEMFQYHWSFTKRKTLLDMARRVVVINRDEQVAHRLKRMIGDDKNKIMHVHLDNWDGANKAMESTLWWEPDLVLMSAALGSKWIGPEISHKRNCVVLDLGQAADVWHERSIPG